MNSINCFITQNLEKVNVVKLALKALLLSLSITKRSGLLVNGRKSDGYMQFDPVKGLC